MPLPSQDTIDGGAGDDYIDARGNSSGALFFLGGSGDNDTIYGKEYSQHYIMGGAGNDILYGGDIADNIVGNEGNDEIYGGLGADYIYGDGGNDTLYAVDSSTNSDLAEDHLFGGETLFYDPLEDILH